MRESIIPSERILPVKAGRDRLIDRTARRALLARLARIEHGVLEIVEDGERHRFGSLTERCGIMATVTVTDPRFWSELALGGNTGAGEAYIAGYFRCDDLTAAVRILVQNRAVLEGLEGGGARLAAPVKRLAHWVNRNTQAGSRKNIAAHYDLGNDLFELFLDETMMYSSAMFATGEETLEEAQVLKLDAICRKLELGPEDHLLEIGTGWGGLAIHAAGRYGCRVTTTTISREQHKLASERVREAGLEDRITLLLEDYRDLEGRYDKLVSVEMIEAVGHHFLDTYIAKCGSLLKPDGMMLLQAITIRDQHYANALKTVDFIKKFVFPGSFIPSVTAIADSIAASSDMRIFHLQDFGPDYARTLRLWRERFFERIDAVRQLGYPEPFVRLWEYYLCYCEGGFTERNIGVVHMLLTKPDCRRAPLAF
jgi:cyclopropane-fatty-acyl-phospholipid synthase